MYSSLFRFRKNWHRDETEPLKQGSVDRACDSRFQGHEFKSHLGYRDYFLKVERTETELFKIYCIIILITEQIIR